MALHSVLLVSQPKLVLRALMTQYSNDNFFGWIRFDNQKFFFVPGASKNTKLAKNVSRKASRTPRLDETGEFEVDRSVKIFGSAQCTRDLSSYECRKCLNGAISLPKSYCKRQEGARVFTESCNIRYYELYKYF
ncbi:Gnk2-like domain containing protein [Parasponia andersonii]|uniref:Gnk2-like domain containing protein n=1 Tax=Parasponia andersonii TaxID=3476 RepID=A0A2P5BI89_PARAD|nr:Gnk2-like domain containing protein [Parasponia andersonii]